MATIATLPTGSADVFIPFCPVPEIAKGPPIKVPLAANCTVPVGKGAPGVIFAVRRNVTEEPTVTVAFEDVSVRGKFPMATDSGTEAVEKER